MFHVYLSRNHFPRVVDRWAGKYASQSPDGGRHTSPTFPMSIGPYSGVYHHCNLAAAKHRCRPWTTFHHSAAIPHTCRGCRLGSIGPGQCSRWGLCCMRRTNVTMGGGDDVPRYLAGGKVTITSKPNASSYLSGRSLVWTRVIVDRLFNPLLPGADADADVGLSTSTLGIGR